MHSSKSFLKVYQQAVGPDIVEEIAISLFGHNIGAIQYEQKSDTFYFSDLAADAIFAFNVTSNDKR